MTDAPTNEKPTEDPPQETRPRLVVELKELDEIYSRFRKIFILSNLLTVLLAVYVIAHLMFPEKFEAKVFVHMQSIGLCVLLAGSILLCFVQGLCLHKTTQHSRKKIEELTFSDALTGVYNYRYLDRRLDEEIRIARRFHTTISLIYLDIDNFKQINDDHGHQAGNAALHEIGRVLTVAGRATDLVGRLGGDEFLILLPNTDRDEAQIVAERIRSRIENHAFHVDSSNAFGLRVSMGVAAFPFDSEEKEGLISGADQAMYRAKQAGGNRVCI